MHADDLFTKIPLPVTPGRIGSAQDRLSCALKLIEDAERIVLVHTAFGWPEGVFPSDVSGALSGAAMALKAATGRINLAKSSLSNYRGAVV